MNTLKIQIKPYYQNNPFNLKDDQIQEITLENIGNLRYGKLYLRLSTYII